MIHWDPSPEIFTLGPLAPRWYGLLFALGFVAGYHVFKRIAFREKVSLAHVDRILLYLGIGTILGARLGHVFFYEPEHYFSDPVRILKIWEGGLASHGAMIGVILSLYYYSKKFPELGFMWLLDRLSISAAIAGAFIRLGNLFNSEIVGEPTKVPWAFVFERVDAIPRHPAQLYECLAYIGIFGILHRFYWKRHLEKKPGTIFGSYLTLVFSARFLIEFIKENQVEFEASLPLNMGQLLSVPAILIGVWLIFRARSSAAAD